MTDDVIAISVKSIVKYKNRWRKEILDDHFDPQRLKIVYSPVNYRVSPHLSLVDFVDDRWAEVEVPFSYEKEHQLTALQIILNFSLVRSFIFMSPVHGQSVPIHESNERINSWPFIISSVLFSFEACEVMGQESFR